MILRKPYALLIKNFKKIHIVLSIIMIYMIVKCNGLLSFFKDYIAHGAYAHTGSLADNYIGIYLYISIAAIILITLVIYILMRQKKKPTILYFVMIIFYMALIIYLFQASNTLSLIEITAISPQAARVYRDIALISTLFQYVLITLVTVRAVGFDIKKFNFGEDIEQLKIEASDNEEFELTVGVDTRRITRGLRRQGRELKYFFFENIFIISIIIAIVIIITSIGLYLNFGVYNKVYNEGSIVAVNNLALQVNKSYYTHNNNLGEDITPQGKIYVVVNLAVENRGSEARILYLDGVSLATENKNYRPVINRYPSFVDLGIGYNNQKIKSGGRNNYIFIFGVDEVNFNVNNLVFRYTDYIYYNQDKLKASYKKIKLNALSLDNKTTVGNTKLGEKAWLGQSLLGKTTLTINNMEINDTFTYQANICIQDACVPENRLITIDSMTSTKATLMHLVVDYKRDNAPSYIDVNKAQSLLATYGKIKYTINNKDYYTKLIDRTPSNSQEKDLYMQVSSNVKDAKYINLILTIRDKEYIFNLKTS